MAEITVQARWLLDASMLPAPANQTLIQPGDGADGYYLTFGHLNPPIFDGLAPGEEPSQAMLDGQVLPVVPVARLLLTEIKLVELRDKINTVLDTVEQGKAGQ